MRRSLIVSAAIALSFALATPPAGASPVTIPGSPLQLTIDDRGGLAVYRTGSMSPDLARVAGFSFYPFVEAAPFGANDNLVTTTAGPSVVGTGTAADPYVATVEYEPRYFVTGVQVTIVLTYVNGDDHFRLRATVHNTGINDRTMRAAVLAWPRPGVSDIGWGEAGTLNGMRYVAAVNDVDGGFVAIGQAAGSPWLSYEEDAAEEMGLRTITNGMWNLGGMFHNRVNSAWTKPALGVDFAPGVMSGIPAGGTKAYEVWVEFGAFDALTLSAPSGAHTAGSAVAVGVLARNHGDALAGRLVRFAVTGANPQNGTVTTTAGGTSSISWSGVHPGSDQLHAYLDTNGNATEDDDEPADDVTLDFAAPPAATPTSTPTPIAPTPLGKVTARAPHVLNSTGAVVLRLAVPAAGKLTGVETARVGKRAIRVGTFATTAKAAGVVRITLKPNRIALKLLRRHRSVPAAVKVTFTPTGGTPRTVTLKLVLRVAR